jgi:glycosyltransferase involved in cell wall biosynthesis
VPDDAAILVPPGDAAALAAALCRLLDDRALLSRLAQAAARHGAALMGWDEATAHWRGAVARLLA